MEDETFGSLLRAARKRASLHTIAAFADALSERGLVYTDDAIGHWENDRRRPYSSDEDRSKVMRIFQLLVQEGGIVNPAQIDTMLAALDRPALSEEEKAAFFPDLGAPIVNLPEKPPYDRLVGRDEVLAAVSQALQDTHGKAIVVVSGLGGIGKTAVAYEVVKHVMQSERFEKLAWETAKSEEFTGTSIRHHREQTISFPNVLASYARQLGFESLTTQSPEALRVRLRDALRSGSYLIVLDNLETLEAAQNVARQLYELVQLGRSGPSFSLPHPCSLRSLPLPNALGRGLRGGVGNTRFNSARLY